MYIHIFLEMILTVYVIEDCFICILAYYEHFYMSFPTIILKT